MASGARDMGDRYCGECGTEWSDRPPGENHLLECQIFDHPKKYGIKLSQYGFRYGMVNKCKGLNKIERPYIVPLSPRKFRVLRKRASARRAIDLLQRAGIKRKSPAYAELGQLVKECETLLERWFIGPSASELIRKAREHEEVREFRQWAFEGGRKAMPQHRFTVDGRRVEAVWTKEGMAVWFVSDGTQWVQHDPRFNPNEYVGGSNGRNIDNWKWTYTNPEDEIDVVMPFCDDVEVGP